MEFGHPAVIVTDGRRKRRCNTEIDAPVLPSSESAQCFFISLLISPTRKCLIIKVVEESTEFSRIGKTLLLAPGKARNNLGITARPFWHRSLFPNGKMVLGRIRAKSLIRNKLRVPYFGLATPAPSLRTPRWLRSRGPGKTQHRHTPTYFLDFS
jgi:hypothetical protein